MTFEETLAHVREILEQEGRVAYRMLKRRFALDDDDVEDLKADLVDAKHLAVDEDGKVLVWAGGKAKEALEDQGTGETEERAEGHPPHQALDSARGARDAERRQLTVLFCDLVGSTPLAEQLDPEDLREVVQAYQTTCTAVVHRFGGYTARYVGDALLAYFGYPQAHEDDPQRAVRAGLGIVDAVQTLSLPQVQLPQALQVRIGIHTGLVVVGELGGRDYREAMALGETPNVAARIQGQAGPDTVIISAATYHLVEGLFECEDRGRPELKGVSTPLTLYRVLKAGDAQSRFEVAVRTGLTPLVGREAELGVLRQRWEQAKAGGGQVVLLSGEPGIGKSRLVQELKEQLAHEGATRIEFRCSPYHRNSALYPVIDHWQRRLQFAREDAPAVKLEKLRHTLSPSRFPQADTVPLLAALLSLPHPAGYPPLTVSPQKQKEKTQAALVGWLVEEAEQNTLYTTWEDVHWADPSTLELLTLLLAQLPTTRLLAMLTYRPEFSPPWGSPSYVSQLTLSRLGQPDVAVMVEQVTGGKVLPTEIVRQIASKTDGVPLFVEELTKMVVESGGVRAVNSHYELTGPLAALTIPSTLQDSLMARLDRLGTAKEVAQHGATIGREFSYELLQAVSPLEAASLQQGLKQLVEAELVYQRGLFPQARYVFKHALIQDTAYQSLLKSTRQHYHHQIVQVLAERFPETAETQPELLAHHYTEAGLSAQAILYWQQAGQKASQRSANAEAMSHLTKGLELLKTLPDTLERTQQELDLQITLGPVLIVLKGNADPEVERVYTRARALCQRVGETPRLFTVLAGLNNFYRGRGKHQTARELGEQLLGLAQRVQDPALLLEAHLDLGGSLYLLGELIAARMHLQQSMALYDPRQHHSNAFVCGGMDPGVNGLCSEVVVLWSLGYPDQALKRSYDALTLAQELSHPASLAVALANAAALHQQRGEIQATQRQTEEMIALSREQGFLAMGPLGTVMQGWVLAEQGQVEEGIAKLHQGVAASRATGAEAGLPYWLSLLAGAYAKGGRVEEGLAVLTEALDMVHKNGQRMSEPGLYVLKGWLLLARSGDNQAEAKSCFRQAIDIARRQSAKSSELRAVVGLSFLLQSQGKKEEARQMLAEIYGWFTEGFDRGDLRAAKALLQELS